MISRRDTLSALGLTALALPGLARAADPTSVCADPAKLTLAQRSQRRSIGYAEPSTDSTKRCGLCAFFTASAEGCGTCQLMSGSPVSGTGLCRSFAPKGA
jgi:High potential iron-sulfur protein